MLELRRIISTPENKATSAIICLPGRGGHAFDLVRCYSNLKLYDTVLIGITPIERQWYPAPYSPTNQAAAVSGLEKARNVIEDVIDDVQKTYDLARDKIALCGFSAGGVMAIYTLIHAEKPLAGVICHAGAILEPENVPSCKFSDVPIVLTHSQDDMDFKWNERYLPMSNSLENNGWNIYCVESAYGGHSVDDVDLKYGAYILSERFGYSKEWQEENSVNPWSEVSQQFDE